MSQYIINFKRGGHILEIGGGDIPLKDAAGNRMTTNMDIREGSVVDIVHDLSVFPWPVDDNSYEGIFGMYCLEHLSFHDIKNAVGEVYRILKPGGKAIFFVPNTYEQCKKIVSNGISEKTIELLFGSQEFDPRHIGAHKTGFSDGYAKKLFEEAGFGFIKIFPHPVSSTDLIIEAYKLNLENVYERSYFEDGIYGYRDYRDFATHYTTARIIEAMKPSSVLDVGAGRGYIMRILENHGIKVTAMDISKHAWHTRVTDNFILHDALVIPWPALLKEIYASGDLVNIEGKMPDKSYDLTFSMNFLEHIPEEKLDSVIKEMTRVSNRGLHGIHTTDCPWEELDPDIDVTHAISQPKQWWIDRFKSVVPEYDVIIEHPRALEYERPEQQPPISICPNSPDNLVKLNIGSYLDMFYYGWKNIDIIDLHRFAEQQAYHFIQHDITKGIPGDNESVDIIMSNHLIEHLSRQEGEQFLRECYRVLKSKGTIRISTPDAWQISNNYFHGDIMEYRHINVGVETADDDAEAYYNLLLAGHKTIYDEKSLIRILEKTGFKNITRPTPFESRSEAIKTQTLTTHPSISLVIEAEK